ncbi:hypothetical protein KI688_010120 [Linnemannia hyalina]|uniref:carnosine N-methyltransferase n=1 Tax=Linnemannia hyalina TaxID=64524 RepID=A0A9P7XZU1_9FUNG|nr:hypothetical protein KI688_010120 [Linnemannia hyalina]
MNPADQGHHQTSLQAGIRLEQNQTARPRDTISDRPGFDDYHHDQHQQHHGGHSHSHDHGHSHDHAHGGHGHSQDHGHDHGEHGSLEDNDAVHEETLHFHKIIKAFSQYKASAMYANHRRRTDFYSLPERQQKMLPTYLERMERIDDAIEANYEIIKIICEDQQIFVNEDRATAKGKPERDAIYEPLIQELRTRFASVPVEQRGGINVLVPGSGLGRLAFDIAHEGFSAQGNEFSYYMLLASNFILNKSQRINQFKIYPYIHSFSNIAKSSDVLTEASIPDVNPSEIPRGTDFSMVAGDFIEVYGMEEENYGKWDAVVTCFFIDTAKNIVDYLETIHKILKKGGVWINAGPLLWHFENTPNEISVELSLEEVIELAKTIGFKMEIQEPVKSTYMANPHGMLKYVYECARWTATKV